MQAQAPEARGPHQEAPAAEVPDLGPNQHATQDGAPTHADDHIQTHQHRRKKNVMDMRRSITRGTLTMLLVALAMPAAVAEASMTPTASPPPNTAPYSARIVKTLVYNSRAELSNVDCIGNGAHCVGYLKGTQGEVHVTNNTNPHYYWRFKLTCEFGGDQYSGDNPPSAGTVKSHLGCNFGAPAKYWNVLVEYKP
jgi:hypothetical protein